MPIKRLLKGRKALETVLQLMEQYRIPATWATVGHLFLDSCAHTDGKFLIEIIENCPWSDCDWFKNDLKIKDKRDSLWYAPDLVEKISESSVKHEIASHSFSHVIFDESSITWNEAKSDFDAFSRSAERVRINPISFVYPTHKEGFKLLLVKHGFKIYRGTTIEPFVNRSPWLRKLLRFFMRILSVPSHPVIPTMEDTGLIHLPASMHFALRPGLAGWMESGKALYRRATKGINRTVRDGGFFTIYFHDHNFGFRQKEHLYALENVFKYVAWLRDSGKISIMTMSDISKIFQ